MMGLFVYWHQAKGLFDWLPNLLFTALLFLLAGAVGGAALGLAYHWLAEHEATKGERTTPRPRWWQISRVVVLLILAGVGLVVVWNLAGLIRYRDADLQAVIPVGAHGTNWADLLPVAEGEQPIVFASSTGMPFVAWVEAGDIFYTAVTGAERGECFPLMRPGVRRSQWVWWTARDRCICCGRMGRGR
ncbi:MAG: hypothetical protein HC804_03865 [Anaerolineae bacterium]|nr:hypothetical protein [Anaerolineae bacterium]